MTGIDELEVDRSDQTAVLHHNLKGVTNDFFFTDISKRDTLLGEAFDMLEKIFETHKKQQQMRQSLTCTNMDSLQHKLSVSKRQALTETYNRILRLSPSFPPTLCGDRRIMILLCDAFNNESSVEDN
jgi:hypothetical protein